MAHAITVADVSKTYRGGVAALRGVSLAVAEGEIFGLLGRNGAGKTTLVKILLDLVRPTTGTAQLGERSCRDSAARRPVGYLPEDHRFPEYHTATSALHFYGGLSGLRGAALRRRTDELLEYVGLAAAASQKVRGFSKGMKQRLGLAQALVADPRILFLDEPTDGVDPVGRAEIRSLLEHLRAEGRTIFLNSHLLSEVETLCDRVGILHAGELVRCGTIPELTQAELTYTITTAAPVAAPIVAEVAALVVRATATATGLEVALAAESTIDAVVDLLRARGVALRGLAGKRHSLEAVFLESVRAGQGSAS